MLILLILSTSRTSVHKIDDSSYKNVWKYHKVGDAVIDTFSNCLVATIFYDRTAHGTLRFRESGKEQNNCKYNELFHRLIIRGHKCVNNNTCNGDIHPNRKCPAGDALMFIKFLVPCKIHGVKYQR